MRKNKKTTRIGCGQLDNPDLQPKPNGMDGLRRRSRETSVGVGKNYFVQSSVRASVDWTANQSDEKDCEFLYSVIVFYLKDSRNYCFHSLTVFLYYYLKE